MNSKVRWLPVFPIAAVALFVALSSLALGQGPVLTSLPTPTPMPPPPGAAPAPDVIAQGPLPDLVVEKIETDPATPLVGQSTVISVTIKNQGNGPVPEDNNFFTDLYIDPPIRPPLFHYHQIESPTLGLPWGAQWFFVPPGGSHTFTTTWVFTDVRTFDVWALVDSDDNVIEDNDDPDVNSKNINVEVRTAHAFTQDTHQDFLTNMASTLDNSDPTGKLRLGHFEEPPFIGSPFNDGCEIRPDTVSVSDYNMEAPDTRINQDTSGSQEKPHLIANGNGVVVAVWEDGRNGEIANRDIYMRYSIDWGETWQPEVKVNDDTYYVNQLNPAAALSEDGNLLVAWQDRRSHFEDCDLRQPPGNCYDIYIQRFTISGTILTRSGVNIEVPRPASDDPGDRINPDIAVDEAGGFHVTWQNNRLGRDDIFATSYVPDGGGGYVWKEIRLVSDPNDAPKQNPSIQILDWLEPTGISYTVAPTSPYTVTVTGVISRSAQVFVVTWEDFRNDPDNPKDTPDIAMSISTDSGESFDVDQFITQSDTDGKQQNPDVTLTKDTTTLDFTVPLSNSDETSVEVEVPVGNIHTVWEGYSTSANLDNDIYYNASQLQAEEVGDGYGLRLILDVGPNEKINQDDNWNWQTTPVLQREPSLVVVPCDATNEEESGWNLFIAWADGRNYDSLNYDIFYTLKSTCGANLAGDQMLNDGIRLHGFDSSNPNYDDYDAGSPPPGKQLNPSVAADIQLQGLEVSGGYLYLAWVDNRAGDHPNAEKDIFFARSNLTFFNQGGFGYGAGSFISDILDSEDDDTTWYTIDWSAATPSSTYVTVQTRLGNTITDVLASEWYPQRFPYQPQPPECDATRTGAPVAGYQAGGHIEDASGDFWPKARYIQYRVNYFTRDSTHTPELDDLTIFFDSQAPDSGNGNGKDYFTYLPLIMK